MNPLFHLARLFGVRKGLERRCPKCGRAVSVPHRSATQMVRCPACGASVPPKTAA